MISLLKYVIKKKRQIFLLFPEIDQLTTNYYILHPLPTRNLKTIHFVIPIIGQYIFIQTDKQPKATEQDKTILHHN